MIPGDLLSAFSHRQFHTLPGLLDSWAALPNSNPNACMPMQGGSLYHVYGGLWYDPAESRTHDLPCERRTRYRLSQPDTVVVTCTLSQHLITFLSTLNIFVEWIEQRIHASAEHSIVKDQQICYKVSYNLNCVLSVQRTQFCFLGMSKYIK